MIVILCHYQMKKVELIMDIEERKRQLLHDMAVLIAEMDAIDAQERRIRRFKWQHPIKYWRRSQTPARQRYKFLDDVESGKIPGIIN